jgi:hypothetical protein
MITVQRDQLVLAVEHVTGGETIGASAFIDRRTGAILFGGADCEVPLPVDVYEDEHYIPVPTKKELGLGRGMALTFSEQHAPHLLESAEHIFATAGAFERFKRLMHEHGLLKDWYAYQEDRLSSAVQEWAEQHGLGLFSA